MSQITSATGNIDPNSFTPDELLKHIYRTLQDINKGLEERDRNTRADKIVQDRKIESLQKEVTTLQTRIDEKEKAFKSIITLITVGLLLLTTGLSFAVYTFGR